MDDHEAADGLVRLTENRVEVTPAPEVAWNQAGTAAFCTGSGASPHAQSFPGYPYVILPDSRLVLTWHFVPYALVLDPDHPIHTKVGRVNQLEFLGRPPGSLLYEAPAIRRYTPAVPEFALWPETAAFGRILDWRSRGVHDLVTGLAEDVPPLPRARYHLVAATLTRSERHPVGSLVGDLLVRPRSAYGRDGARTLFPDADVLHVGGTDHFGLLNHPDVHQALREWLG